VKSIAEKIADLKGRLDNTEREIKSIISELKYTTETSNLYYAGIKVKLNKTYREINNIYMDWSKSEIPDSFNGLIKKEIQRVKAYKIPVNKNIDYKTVINRDSNKQSYTAIMKESIATFQQSLQTSEKRINRILYTTQQTAITEKKLNELLNQGLINNNDMIQRTSSSKLLKDKLLEQGEKVLIIDKNGNERNYDVKDYAELVARTKLRAIQSESTVAVCNELDTDLVKISSHNTETELCQEYEGKVFSLTGKNPDFEVIDMLPPFHINCKHSIHPIFAEALRITGDYEKYAKE